MAKTIITKKELDVPVGVLIDVAELLIENEITHQITATDEDEETITLEVEYNTKERDAIRQVENIISDFNDDAEEPDDNDDEQS